MRPNLKFARDVSKRVDEEECFVFDTNHDQVLRDFKGALQTLSERLGEHAFRVVVKKYEERPIKRDEARQRLLSRSASSGYSAQVITSRAGARRGGSRK